MRLSSLKLRSWTDEPLATTTASATRSDACAPRSARGKSESRKMVQPSASQALTRLVIPSGVRGLVERFSERGLISKGPRHLCSQDPERNAPQADAART